MELKIMTLKHKKVEKGIKTQQQIMLCLNQNLTFSIQQGFHLLLIGDLIKPGNYQTHLEVHSKGA
jgi:hypothetical protein